MLIFPRDTFITNPHFSSASSLATSSNPVATVASMLQNNLFSWSSMFSVGAAILFVKAVDTAVGSIIE